VDQRTRQHLDLAERNRDLSRAILDPAISGNFQPSPYEWIAVIAFYAAVHYVSAYLWETYGEVIEEHPARWRRVRTEGRLQRCKDQYGRLQNNGYNARYTRGIHLSRQDAERLVNIDLANVESVVMAAL
jgi:hypothetical protein